jgi:hypothetical protein
MMMMMIMIMIIRRAAVSEKTKWLLASFGIRLSPSNKDNICLRIRCGTKKMKIRTN